MPILHVTKEPDGRYNLALQDPRDADPKVIQDLPAIAIKHSLPPVCGCYEVNAIDPDNGREIRYLRGMYVQPEKYDAVVKDLRALGYTIIEDWRGA